jgi:hypothetical protein
MKSMTDRFLQNKLTTVLYEPLHKRVTMWDKRDAINDPTAYNKTVRGLEKAMNVLTDLWTKDFTMYDAINVLNQNGIRMHSYCAMD